VDDVQEEVAVEPDVEVEMGPLDECEKDDVEETGLV
jgi:hypothetical protein